MRILIIEDDKSLSELLVYGLECDGFQIEVCNNGEDGLNIASTDSHDLILLDRMLPGMSGEKILEQIRKKSIRTPVIFITALGDSAEKINGLDLGADDYLVKPFDMGELSARIRSVMRRTSKSMDYGVFSYGNLKYSEPESKLFSEQDVLILTKRESELFSYFFRNTDRVLSRQQIIGNVWGMDTEIEDGNLDNYIYLLRKRLSSIATNVKIQTIHRQGYLLTVD